MSEDLIAVMIMLAVVLATISGVLIAYYIQRSNARRDHRRAFDAWRHQAPQEYKSDE